MSTTQKSTTTATTRKSEKNETIIAMATSTLKIITRSMTPIGKTIESEKNKTRQTNTSVINDTSTTTTTTQQPKIMETTQKRIITANIKDKRSGSQNDTNTTMPLETDASKVTSKNRRKTSKGDIISGRE